MHSDKTFRVGLIGYGLAGEYFHAPFIATTPGLQLGMIVTRDPERQARAAREHPGARLADSVEDVWNAAGELDAVVVATPNRSHVEIARAAIDAGLAVVIDKPIAATAADAHALIAYARAKGRLLTVYQNRRWDGDFLTLRRIVQDGAVGEPHRFESRIARWRPTPRPGWRQSAVPGDAGGVLFDFGIHLIDQALVLFGPVASVYAEMDHRHATSEVDDDSFIALKHRSGVRSHLVASLQSAEPGPRFRLFGSKAAYVKCGMDVQEEALRGGRRPGGEGWGEEPVGRWGQLGAGEAVQPVPTAAGAYQEFYRGLVRALQDGGPPPVDPLDAARAVEVIEAARRAAATGQVVDMAAHDSR